MQVQRFNFEKLQDFKHPLDELEDVVEVEEEAAPPPPPPPTFSLNDLETAKRISFEEGRQAGIKEGIEQSNSKERQQLTTVDQVCSRLAAEIETIRNRHIHYITEQGKDLSALVMMICRKVAGDVTSAIPSSGVEQMVSDCIGILMHQPKVNLVVHPDMANHMGEIIALKLKQMHIECAIQVSGDSTLATYEGRLEWKNGSVERNISTIWKQVEGKLETVDFALLARLKAEEEPAKAAAIVQMDADVSAKMDSGAELVTELLTESSADIEPSEIEPSNAELSEIESSEAESSEAEPISQELAAIEEFVEEIAAESPPITRGKRSKVEEITTPPSEEGDD